MIYHSLRCEVGFHEWIVIKKKDKNINSQMQIHVGDI